MPLIICVELGGPVTHVYHCANNNARIDARSCGVVVGAEQFDQMPSFDHVHAYLQVLDVLRDHFAFALDLRVFVISFNISHTELNLSEMAKEVNLPGVALITGAASGTAKDLSLF